MNIKLYIGAHKTATTHIQKIFDSHRSYLNDNQCSVSIPINLRESWLPNFITYCNNKDHTLANKIVEISPQNNTWILAEENFSGTPSELLVATEIYPNIAKRLENFCDIFDTCSIEVFFSIRSYETFYRSSYLEIVRNKGYLPFDEFYQQERFQHFSWIKVIQSINQLIDHDKIHIWCYEDLRELLPSLLSTMSDNIITRPTLEFKKPNSITRPSMSNKCIDIIKKDYPNAPQKITEELINKYPANDINGYYMPFSDDQIFALKSQYKNELKEITSRFPNIQLLGSKLNKDNNHDSI